MERFNQNNTHSNAHGFTLIEVLISITILSFITYGTYRMINTNTDTKDRVVKEDRQIIQTIAVIGRLDSDISQIYNPLFSSPKEGTKSSDGSNPYEDSSSSSPNSLFEGRAKNGQLIPQFKSESKSSIVFLTQANRRKIADSRESRFAWVKYGLENMEEDLDEPEKKNIAPYAMVRQSIATDIYNTSLDWSKVKSQTVLENVKSLEFSFWDERKKKFTDSIQELNENKNLIRSIKVKIIWVNSDNNEQVIEKTFRVLSPYFNTKIDELKNSVDASPPPPGLPGTPKLPGEEGEENE